MYDCKLMEIRRAFFAGWMGCGSALSLWRMVDGGWRMTDAWETGAGLLRASSGAASRLPEFC